jgi:hypothetical protein
MAGKKTLAPKVAKTKPQFISQIVTQTVQVVGQKTLAAKVAKTSAAKTICISNCDLFTWLRQLARKPFC